MTSQARQTRAPPQRAGTTRRPQAERRRATQDAILRAAIDVLVEQGYARFSTIVVAKRAGVSRGARENYYRTKYDLIAAAWRAALVRAIAQASELARQAGSDDPLERFLQDSQSFFLGRDYMALLELSVAARTDRTLMRIFHRLYREHRKTHDEIWIDTLVQAGYRRPQVESFVEMTHYLLRGMALTAVWQPQRSAYAPGLEEWRRLAALALKRVRRPAAPRGGSGAARRRRAKPATSSSRPSPGP